MGESITEGTIINWLVNEGDSFNEGDIILEVATDKVDNEVPAPASGKLTKTHFQAKDVVPVGTVIATLELSEAIERKSEDVISVEAEDKKSSKAKKQVKKQPVAAQPPVLTGAFSTANTNTFFSPLVIKIAKEHHISFEELARIPATGKRP